VFAGQDAGKFVLAKRIKRFSHSRDVLATMEKLGQELPRNMTELVVLKNRSGQHRRCATQDVDGSQRSGHDCLTAIKDAAIGRADAVAEITVPLSLQKQIHGGVSHGEHSSKGTAFEIIEAGPFLHGPANKASKVLSHLHKRNRLAQSRRKCDDHATASMRVVGKTNSMTKRPSQGGQRTRRCGAPFIQVVRKAARVDEVCRRFEAAWKAAASLGQRPQMEDYEYQTAIRVTTP
jgi:hypothetical protein